MFQTIQQFAEAHLYAIIGGYTLLAALFGFIYYKLYKLLGGPSKKEYYLIALYSLLFFVSAPIMILFCVIVAVIAAVKALKNK